MSQQDGKVLCLVDGQRVQGWEGPAEMKRYYRNTPCQSLNDANGKWAE